MISGIYRILNKISGKTYIGSTSNFRKRGQTHFHYLRKGKHPNKHLQASFLKYGEEAFIFEPLLSCSVENLLFFEQQFLDQWKPEYNAIKIAGGKPGFKRSEENRIQMAEVRRGRKFSEETRRRMSEVKAGKILSSKKRKGTQSRFYGVTKSGKKWRAFTKLLRISHSLGQFIDEREAARAVNLFWVFHHPTLPIPNLEAEVD